MGLESDSAGISLQFYDANVEPSGSPIFGRFTYLCSVPRATVPARTQQDFTATELQNPGSDDWLTVVAVADTPARLEALVPSSTRADSCSLSSCASCRVMIRVHVGNKEPETFPARTVIASGPVIFVEKESDPTKEEEHDPTNPQEPPKVEARVRVVHVKVFDPAAPMDSSHKMIKEFRDLASMLNTLNPPI